jgi:hypothetical protein
MYLNLLLTTYLPAAQECIARLVAELADKDENELRLVEAGCLPVLVSLLKPSDRHDVKGLRREVRHGYGSVSKSYAYGSIFISRASCQRRARARARVCVCVCRGGS